MNSSTQNPTIQTYDRIAYDYLVRRRDRNAIRHHMEKFVSLVVGQNLGGQPVVDIGCGPGFDLQTMRNAGRLGIGLDLSRGMLEIGSQHNPGYYVQADMRHLPFGELLGGLWSCASLLHLPRQEAPGALREFARVLVDGGVLYLSVKMGEGQNWSTATDGQPGRRLFTMWQPLELDALIENAGFQIVQATAENNDGGTVWLARFGLKIV